MNLWKRLQRKKDTTIPINTKSTWRAPLPPEIYAPAVPMIDPYDMAPPHDSHYHHADHLDFTTNHDPGDCTGHDGGSYDGGGGDCGGGGADSSW